jgi:hypothetical protein
MTNPRSWDLMTAMRTAKGFLTARSAALEMCMPDMMCPSTVVRIDCGGGGRGPAVSGLGAAGRAGR